MNEIDGPIASFFEVDVDGDIKRFYYQTYGWASKTKNTEDKDELISRLNKTINYSYEVGKILKVEKYPYTHIDKEPLLVWRRRLEISDYDEGYKASCRYVVVPPQLADAVRGFLEGVNA